MIHRELKRVGQNSEITSFDPQKEVLMWQDGDTG